MGVVSVSVRLSLGRLAVGRLALGRLAVEMGVDNLWFVGVSGGAVGVNGVVVVVLLRSVAVTGIIHRSSSRNYGSGVLDAYGDTSGI